MIGAPEPESRPTPGALKRAAREAAEASYDISGGTLRVVGAIGYDLNPEFRRKCEDLLASDEKDLLLDLSQVLYLSSPHINVIAQLAIRAVDPGKKLKIRAPGKVVRILRFAGFDRLGELEIVD